MTSRPPRVTLSPFLPFFFNIGASLFGDFDDRLLPQVDAANQAALLEPKKAGKVKTFTFTCPYNNAFQVSSLWAVKN